MELDLNIYSHCYSPSRDNCHRLNKISTNLATPLRRYGHISEQTPGNIASSLQGPMRQARPGAYHVQENQQGLRQATQATTSGVVSSFFGNSQDQAFPVDPWSSLVPQDMQDPFASWAPQAQQVGEAIWGSTCPRWRSNDRNLGPTSPI